MRYVISDIHGCYEEYTELLEKLHLTDRDFLYILGDTLDKGPEPIKVLQDLMCRKNVIYIIGNHDYLFLYFMQKLKSDLSEVHNFSEEDITDFKAYLDFVRQSRWKNMIFLILYVTEWTMERDIFGTKVFILLQDTLQLYS